MTMMMMMMMMMMMIQQMTSCCCVCVCLFVLSGQICVLRVVLVVLSVCSLVVHEHLGTNWGHSTGTEVLITDTGVFEKERQYSRVSC
jgi:hypothetical protein